MAMLQRRMASSVYAVRRSLERMRDRRAKILADPDKFRRDQIANRIPDDFDDLDDEEQQRILSDLESEVLSYDPAVLREEIAQLSRLIGHAKQIESRDNQTKLNRLRSVLTHEGIFDDPQMKLLVFTEHKDTLDYLAADGKDGRPLGKLREWGLTVTQIHGGMKIGDRDTPGSRIYAEREFRDSAQVLVAKRELNMSAIVGRSAEAKERRLVPEVVEQFFLEAAPESGVHPRPIANDSRFYRIGRVPRNLIPIGDSQEQRFGRLGREYAKIIFDKEGLKADPTAEWVTTGHPLFEAVRADLLARVAGNLHRGAIFYDLHRKEPAVLDIYAASIKDGQARTPHRRLFGVETSAAGQVSLREPTYLHAITPAPQTAARPDESVPLPDRQLVESFLYEHALREWAERAAADRAAEVDRVARHVEISLNDLIDRQQRQLGEYLNRQVEGKTIPGLDGLIAQADQHLDDLNNRLEKRRQELDLERHCSVADITHLGRAWVVPHPERTSPQLAPMVRDDGIEQIAIQEAIRFEQSRGWVAESVETENRGFDLISRRPHPEDSKTYIEVRFIEVKGRAGVGSVALSENEYRTAVRLKSDYWLYAVFNCAGTPELNTIQNPARLNWQAVMTVEHYRVGPEALRGAQDRE